MNVLRVKIQTRVGNRIHKYAGIVHCIAHLASPTSVQASDVLLLYTEKQ